MTSMTVDELAVAEPVRFWTRQRKVGLGLVVAGALAAVIFGALATDQEAKFTLAETTAGSAVGIGGTVGAVLFGLIAAGAGAALLAGVGGRWFSWLLGVGIVGAVVSFLCWQMSEAPTGLNVMPLGDVGAQLAAARAAADPGVARRRVVRALGRDQRRDRRPVPDGCLRGRIGGHDRGQRLGGHRRGGGRRPVHRRDPRRAVDQVPGRPGGARHRAQRVRARADRLPVRADHDEGPERVQPALPGPHLGDPVPVRHPASWSGAVQGQRVRLRRADPGRGQSTSD